LSVSSPTSSKTTASAPESTKEDLTKEELTQQVGLLERKLAGVEAISRAIAHEHSLERILDVVMDSATTMLEAERSTLFLLADDGQTLWSRFTRGGEVATIELAAGTGLAGWVAKHGRAVNVKDAYKDPRFDASLDERTGFSTSSVLCTPLLDSRQKVLGVLQVLNSKGGYFTPADADLIAAIAGPTAIAIHNSHLYLDIVDKNIHLQETSEHLKERTSELELLFGIERVAATSSSFDGAASGVLDALLEEFPSQVAAVVLDCQTGPRSYAAVRGSEADRLTASQDFFELSPPRRDLGEPITVGGLRDTSERTVQLPGSAEWKIRHFVSVPITHQGELLGEMQFANPISRLSFDRQDVRILGVIATRLGMSLALARAQEEESQASRLASIGQALSGVMHDIKTPLTIISGYARLMAHSEERGVRDAHQERVRTQVSLIKDMTQELLAFARGDSEVLLQKVFLGNFMSEIGEHMESEFSETNVMLETTWTGAEAIRVDPNKLKRAVFNLTRNAKEAFEEKPGHVWLHASVDDGQMILTTRDDGPGIPSEMEGRLFDSFATHGKAYGTGLGLAIVKRVVDAHQGTIEVVSAPTEGTTITITIPT
jgi:signal transduction histidine kinase/putative methionine-R-sulfoxide reductase with GAF domain